MKAPDKLWVITSHKGKHPQYLLAGCICLKEAIDSACKGGPSVEYIRKASLPINEIANAIDDHGYDAPTDWEHRALTILKELHKLAGDCE